MLDMTTFGPALKQRYPDWKIEELVYQNNPFFAIVPKWESFTGDVLKMPLIFGNPQARSTVFATANAMTSQSQLRAFLLTRKSDYSLASIQNEVILASEGDAGAFLRAATVEIDGALHSLSRSIATKLFRSGSGSIGRLSAGSGVTTTLTLENVEDVVNFEVGMYLEGNDTDDAVSVKATTGTQGLITAVDRTNGILSLSAAIPTLAAADYLFVRGDAGNALSGLDAWLPYDNRAARLAASFFGVTRNVDATRLGGQAYDGSALSIEEALINASSLVAREGGRPDHVFMNYTDYSNLVKALGSKVQYVNVKPNEDASFGFQGIMVNGPRGSIKAIADQNCPVGRAFLLQMDTWQLASLKKAVNLFDTDGLRMLRSPTGDALDIRCFSYAQLGNKAPGYNAQILLGSN